MEVMWKVIVNCFSRQAATSGRACLLGDSKWHCEDPGDSSFSALLPRGVLPMQTLSAPCSYKQQAFIWPSNMKLPRIGPYSTYYFYITECGMQYFSPASIQGYLPRTSLFSLAVLYVMWEMLVFLASGQQLFTLG